MLEKDAIISEHTSIITEKTSIITEKTEAILKLSAELLAERFKYAQLQRTHLFRSLPARPPSR